MSSLREGYLATPPFEGAGVAPLDPVVPKQPPLAPMLKRAWLPGLLLLVSLFTTAASGARFMRNFRLAEPPLAKDSDFFPLPWALHHPSSVPSGWSFSLALLAILLAHEAGHFFYCRKHRIRASLPYVLPAPTLSGTAGAVIRIRSRISSRAALIEVGVAGPIAGYLVALPIAILGILLSHPLSPHAPPPLMRFHQPLTILLLRRALSFALPRGATGIAPHPILLASWIGFFITSLNLIPAGQLDGGHILYAISPRCHRIASIAAPALLLIMGVTLWIGWLLWGAILLLPVMRHSRVFERGRLRGKPLFLGLAALALLVLTVLPAPFAGSGLLSLLR